MTPKPKGMTENQWEVWTEHAQRVFAQTHSWLKDNQELSSHPEMPEIDEEHWGTIAWNAAWVAANYCDGYETKVET